MKNYVLRALNKNKTMRIFVAQTTDMVQEIRDINKSSATGSAALGRLATISSILGLATLQDDQKLTVSFDGKGLGGKLTAVADSSGDVKVTATNPQADPASKYPGKLDVGAFVGVDGNIAVIKDLGLKDPYVGVSQIVTGEIAEDVASYFFYSEQTPSAVSLGVLVDTDLSIKAAGGIFVQVLPNVTEEDLQELENIVAKLKPVSELISSGMTPEDILDEYFTNLHVEILEKVEVNLKCDCSRDRIIAGLESIGKKDLKEILNEDGKIEVVCDFCKTHYKFNEEDILQMIENAR